MTVERLVREFERYWELGEGLKFERVAGRAHWRPDICAMLMLAGVDSGKEGRSMVGGADGKAIFFDVEVEDLARCATAALVRDLVRCGVVCLRDRGDYVLMMEV